MNDVVRYPWQQFVLDAIVVPREDLPAKINAAEQAISRRLKEPPELDMEERIALDGALRALRLLIGESQTYAESARSEGHEQKKDIA